MVKKNYIFLISIFFIFLAHAEQSSDVISGYTAWGAPLFASYTKRDLTISNRSQDSLFVAIKARGSCDTLCPLGKSGPPCYIPTGCCNVKIIGPERTGSFQKYQDDPVVIYALPQSGGKYVANTTESSVVFPDDFNQTRRAQECSGQWDGWNN